ncbi:MAG TPA: hypothetical protein VN408_29990 [Actinoplanes sp.]|nr:hypothetical protein [Actinoplanes sp.]
MFLMCIGAFGAEKPAVRVDDTRQAGEVRQAGDVVDLGIDRLGSARQHVIGPR